MHFGKIPSGAIYLGWACFGVFSPGVKGVSGLSRGKHERRAISTQEDAVRSYYLTLARKWGPQHWWPAHSRFEVIVGAYLTQNTAWTNVERALAGLRSERLLSLEGIRRVQLATLERLIRPSGYFRQKARRLKIFVAFVDKNYGGSLAQLFTQPTNKLREELLSLNGIGPETADSILLYAGNHPVFVVDAYTRRILERHEIADSNAGYEDVRRLFETTLALVADSQQYRPPEMSDRLVFGLPGAAQLPSRMSTARRTALVQVYNEMHGLIVGVGKTYCRKSQPLCDQCPLQPYLPCRK